MSNVNRSCGPLSFPLTNLIVSPANSTFLSGSYRETLPGVCPGLGMTVSLPTLSFSWSIMSGSTGLNLKNGDMALKRTPMKPLGGWNCLLPRYKLPVFLVNSNLRVREPLEFKDTSNMVYMEWVKSIREMFEDC